MNKANINRQLNCAIYTRKSTDEGLDKEFNSLDAQRECAEAYIKSQTQEGWHCVPDRYDDGGFTGGNMDRPALRQLLADIEAGKVNCVVVYKVDRLSRSLMDFARMLEVFERNQVAFVSVTQQFNTTNSMGRLMLNVLLSFAQFERELISERTRDKIAAARRKGKWSGGMPLLGYDIEQQGGKLRINEVEAIALIQTERPGCSIRPVVCFTFLVANIDASATLPSARSFATALLPTATSCKRSAGMKISRLMSTGTSSGEPRLQASR
jgi:DNA invertase Pin-like site-specific DNA recombinase